MPSAEDQERARALVQSYTEEQLAPMLRFVARRRWFSSLGLDAGEFAVWLEDVRNAKGATMKPVLVTTAHRGVFFGEIDETTDENARTIVLFNCRNAIYWSGSGGFLGLAATGPEQGIRIGTTAPRVCLHDVTSISDCTPESARIWREWP